MNTNQPTLKIVVIYEDNAADDRARRLCHSLASKRGSPENFSESSWKFEFLQNPQMQRVAARDAAEADLVIVSLHGNGELPASVRNWFELWLNTETRNSSTLVAFQDHSIGRRLPHFFETAAQRHGLDFLAGFVGPETNDHCYVWAA